MISRAIERGTAWGLAVAVWLAGGVAVGGDTFRVKTERGTYLVEVDAADITVSGDGEDLVIKPAKGDEIRLKLDSDRSERSSKEPFLAIKRDGKVIVSARRISSGTDSPLEDLAGRSVLGAGAGPSAWSLAITRDGQTLVSGHQGSLKVWDVAILAERFQDHVAKTVRRVAITPDGGTIASAEYQSVDGKPMGKIVIRDGKTGETRRETDPVEALHAVSIDPEARFVAGSSWGSGDVFVWDVKTGERVKTLKGHTGYVGSVAFSPDGKTLASGGDTTVRLWDVAKWEARSVLRGPTKSVETIAFSGDGKRIGSGGYDDKARVWDVATGKLLVTVECDEPVLSVALNSDGKSLATAAARWSNGFYGQAPAEVQVWDVATGKVVVTLPEQPSQVFGSAFTPDGKSLFTASLSGAISLWELAKFAEVKEVPKAVKP